MRTFASIVLVLLMCSVFVIPFIRVAHKPPPSGRDYLPNPPDLRTLDEKVEEQVRLNRAATQIARQRRKAAELRAFRAWEKQFNQQKEDE